jgi:hypothetical protein
MICYFSIIRSNTFIFIYSTTHFTKLYALAMTPEDAKAYKAFKTL